MREITASTKVPIPLGMQGENGATVVKFPIGGWSNLYGDGLFDLVNVRPDENVPYTCSITVDETFVYWIILSADVAIAGNGKCQLNYGMNGKIAKSLVFNTIVAESLDGAGEVPPPYENRIAELITASEDAVEASRMAVAASGSAETNALVSEGHAVGTQGGVPVISGSPYYKNNAQYYAGKTAEDRSETETKAAEARQCAEGAEGNRKDSERYANGEEDGVPVESGKGYHNNSKYFSEQAADSSLDAIEAQHAAEAAQHAAEQAAGTFETDTSLSVPEKAADAHATGDAIDKVIIVSDTEPESEYNKLWIEETGTSVQVPTVGEMNIVVNSVFPTETLIDQSVAEFEDGADNIPVKSLYARINPVQSGSGDPTGDNYRPISGFDRAIVTRTGKNLFGGEKMANDFVAIVNSSANCAKGTDSNGKYVSLSASNAISNKSLFNIKYKENTRYTLIFKASKSNTNATTNLIIYYTGGTYTTINFSPAPTVGTPQTIVLASDANKTIDRIVGLWSSGTTYFYYENCGVFEGVITADGFEAYKGVTTEIVFPDDAGVVYGGTATVFEDGTGELLVNRAFYTIDGTTRKFAFWTGYQPESAYVYYVDGMSNIFPPKAVHTKHMSTCFSPTSLGSNHMSPWQFVSGSGSTTTYLFALPTQYSTAALANDWLKGLANNDTPLQLCLFLDSPVTYPLSVEQVKTLLGLNNIWSNADNIDVTYRADIALYVQKIVESVG